jgi:quercetin dioxygenase-like cupin family protein
MHRFKHSKKAKIAAFIVVGVLTVWVGTSYALTNLSLLLGTTTSYDFGGYGPGYAVPATVQIQAFTLKPGEGVPWHYHKAPSYVIVTHGKLTMQQLVGPDQCTSHEMPRGSGFVENPGMVHTVANTGHGIAVVWWATVYPKSDPIVQYTPEFKSGGIYPVPTPSCSE